MTHAWWLMGCVIDGRPLMGDDACSQVDMSTSLSRVMHWHWLMRSQEHMHAR